MPQLRDVVVAFRVCEPALVGRGQHLGEAACALLGASRIGVTGLAAEDPGEHRALDVHVHRLTLERRLRRTAGAACRGRGRTRRVFGAASGIVAGRDAPAFAAEHRAPTVTRGACVSSGRSANDRMPETKIGMPNASSERHAELAGAIDEILAVNEQLVRAATCAARPARGSSGITAMCTQSSAVQRHAARVDADGRAPRRQHAPACRADGRRRDPAAAARRDRRDGGRTRPGSAGCRRVHVADDREIVAGGERRLVAGGELHVDGLERRSGQAGS